LAEWKGYEREGAKNEDLLVAKATGELDLRLLESNPIKAPRLFEILLDCFSLKFCLAAQKNSQNIILTTNEIQI
jgi:hypothetical protein